MALADPVGRAAVDVDLELEVELRALVEAAAGVGDAEDPRRAGEARGADSFDRRPRLVGAVLNAVRNAPTCRASRPARRSATRTPTSMSKIAAPAQATSAATSRVAWPPAPSESPNAAAATITRPMPSPRICPPAARAYRRQRPGAKAALLARIAGAAIGARRPA